MVGIETDRGPWVQALISSGYRIYAVNPRQAARFKERYGTSGLKSDKGDAHALADMVRIDGDQFCGRSPGTVTRPRRSRSSPVPTRP